MSEADKYQQSARTRRNRPVRHQESGGKSCGTDMANYTDEKHTLNGHLGVVSRLKSRKSFIKSTEPINTTAKATRLELWREILEPLDASVHLNISADEHLPAGAENLWTGTQPVAYTGWPFKSEHVDVGVFQRTRNL